MARGSDVHYNQGVQEVEAQDLSFSARSDAGPGKSIPFLGSVLCSG
jgi:hypothetical protein